MNVATVPYDWGLYDLGFDDGAQDKALNLPDKTWEAVPKRTYIKDYEYWNGYDEGYNDCQRRPHDYRRRLRADLKK